MPRHGFTLIEMMVSMALGLVVIGSLYLGFRAIMSGVKAANRMALENDLMRKAFIASSEEADFWTFYDDPHAGGDAFEPQSAYFRTDDLVTSTATQTPGQGMRHLHKLNVFDDEAARTYIGFKNSALSQGQAYAVSMGGDRQGGIFTPFSQAGDAVTGVRFAFESPLYPMNRVAGAGETARGWDGSCAWAANDPRTWYRGNGNESCNSELQWGRYGLFANIRETPRLGNDALPWGRGDSFLWAVPRTGDFGQVASDHQWRENQLIGLRLTLGLYGMADYLPANTIYATQGGVTAIASGAAWQAKDLDEVRFRGFTGLYRSFVPPGALHSVYPGQWSAMYPMGVFVLPPTQYANWSNPPNTWYSDWTSRSRYLFFNNTMAELRDPNTSGLLQAGAWKDLEAASILRPLMFRRPESWPVPMIGILRARIRTAFVNLARVRITDPASGAVREFSFNVLGTTLRGARQQRRHPADGGGWANAGERTLDGY